MADYRLGILITENFSQANAAWESHERKANDTLKKISGAQETTARNGVKAYDMYRAGALSSIKTIAEYHQEWDGKTTAQLTRHIKSIQDARVDAEVTYRKAIAESDAVKARVAKNELERLSLEGRALKQLSIERPDVQQSGAGGIIGQLGVGRNITNLFQTVSSIFGESKVGFGGSAMIGGASGIGALPGILTAIGPAALSSVGGVAGLAYGLHSLVMNGLEVQQTLSKERTALEQAGVAHKDLAGEMARVDTLALKLSDRWNLDQDRVHKVATEVAFLGRVHGETNSQVVTTSLAVEKMTKDFGDGAISAEAFSKVFNTSDPEREVVLGRLRLKYRDLADELSHATNTGDALRIAMNYLQPTMAGLDREAQSSDEALERAGMAWKNVKREASLAAVEAFTPLLELTSKLATAVNHHAKEVHGLVSIFLDAIPVLGIFMRDMGQLNALLQHSAVTEYMQKVNQLRVEQLHLGESLSGTVAKQKQLDDAFWNARPAAAGIENSITGVSTALHRATLDMSTFMGYMNNLRPDAEKSINAILNNKLIQLHGFIKTAEGKFRPAFAGEHPDGRLSPEESKYYDKVTEHENELLKVRAGNLNEYNSMYKKLSVGSGLEDPEKASGGGASKKAFSTLMEERVRHINDLARVNLLSSHDEIQLLTQTLATLKGLRMKDHDEQLKAQADVQRAIDALVKEGADEQAKIIAEGTKSREDDLKNVKQITDRAAEDEIASLEEKASKGANVEREMLEVKIAAAKKNYDDTVFLHGDIATAEKTLNDLKRQLRMLDNRDALEAGKKRIEIQRQIEDRLAELIADPSKRAQRQAEIKHQRELDSIDEIADVTQQHELKLASEKEYEQKLAEIKDKEHDGAVKIAQDLLRAGVDPLNSALMDQIDLWKKNGSVATSVLQSIMKKLVELATSSLLTGIAGSIGKGGGIFGSLFGGSKSGVVGKPSGEGDGTGAAQMAALLLANVPAFGDSLGPVGNANPPLINGKALVLADPMDWLIKMPVAGFGGPSMPQRSATGEEGDDTIVVGGKIPKKRDVAGDILRRLKTRQQADSSLFNKPSFEGGQRAETGQEATAIGAFLTHFKTDNDAWQRATIQAMLNEGVSADEAIAKVIEIGRETREKFGEKVKEGMAEIGFVTVSAGMSIATSAGGTVAPLGGSGSMAVDLAHDAVHPYMHGLAAGTQRLAGYGLHVLPHAGEHYGSGALIDAAMGGGEGEGESGREDQVNPQPVKDFASAVSDATAALRDLASTPITGMPVASSFVGAPLPQVGVPFLPPDNKATKSTDALADSAKKASDALNNRLTGAAMNASNGLQAMFNGNGKGMISGALGLLSLVPGAGALAPFLSQLPGFATGTDFAPGGWAIVGEHGPEPMYVPRGATIVPNHRMQHYANGVGTVDMGAERIVNAIRNIPSTTLVDQDNFRVSSNRSKNLERNRAF